VGFDYLRDQLAFDPSQQVHRPFAVAVIDEADSILIDEARIPLVIAGGRAGEQPLADRVDRAIRRLERNFHYYVDEYGRNVALTGAGIGTVKPALACGNLSLEENPPLLAAVQVSLPPHALLRRDVDSGVKTGAVEPVEDLRARVARDRRWPAGLHT